jgi:hypothetical protein
MGAPAIATVAPAAETWLSPWCNEDDIPTRRLAKVQDIDIGRMIGVATDLLYCFSGRQYRTGRSRIRPTTINSSYANQSFLYPYSSMSGYGSAWGFAAGWAWTAPGMGWWNNGQDLAEVVLQGPVTRINQVLVNGVELVEGADYTLYDRRRLVRNINPASQGASAWPWEQQLQLPLSYPGTWLIDYEWGRPVPASGWAACVELTIELALSFSGSDLSVLSNRVVSMASEGVSVQVADSIAHLRDNIIPLPWCAAFLKAKNPNGLRRRASFLAPNSVQGRSMPYGQ